MNKEMNREKARIEWVLMNMRLSGSSMNEETASQIAGGQYVLNATLEEHLLVAGLVVEEPRRCGEP